MKKIYVITAVLLILGNTGCTKKELSDAYPNPSTINTSTLEQQFAGFMTSDLNYVLYRYYNYFVDLQNTALHYTQAVGWANAPAQYVPGSAAITDKWDSYYQFLGQYKDFLNIYNQLSTADQQSKRIYLIVANIHFYDQTQKIVDLYGDIPWSKAGLLSTNSGNYQTSYASYDAATDIYTKMLDDLKGYSDELNSISVPTAVATSLKTQDFINHGNLVSWEKYCNSLRLKLLMRVSKVSSFQARVNSELSAITSGNTYPLVLTNADNILVNVYNLTTPINSSDFYSGIIGWGYNDQATKGMIDTMNNNADPRLRFMFQPGNNAGGVYKGLDLTLNSTTATALQAGGTIATYNYSAITKNPYLPGILIQAAEVNFLLAEYYEKAGNDALAQNYYQNGITQSVNFYAGLNALNASATYASIPALGANEISNYLKSNISWSKATSASGKLNLIAVQKWINYSILEPLESWAEVRRTKLPNFTFVPDNTNTLTLPPSRFVYPGEEQTYNTTNYSKVAANDKFTTKLFWDVN